MTLAGRAARRGQVSLTKDAGGEPAGTALDAPDASESSDSAQASAKTPMASLVTPFVAMGATYVARKTLASAYRAATGAAPPSNTDRTVPLGRVLAWAAIGSATAAVIEVVAFRSMARFFGE